MNSLNKAQVARTLKNPDFLGVLSLAIIILILLFANKDASTTISGPPVTHTFADLGPEDNFRLSAETAAAAGAMAGYPCGGLDEPCDSAQRPYFRWNRPLTRRDLAMINTVAQNKVTETLEQIFSDVPPTDPGYGWIQALAGENLLEAAPCGGTERPCDDRSRPYFLPDMGVTRIELARMIYQRDPPDSSDPTLMDTQPFEDMLPSDPNQIYAIYMYQRGFFAGYDCGSADFPCSEPRNRPYFRPNITVSRGQTAKVLAASLLRSDGR